MAANDIFNTTFVQEHIARVQAARAQMDHGWISYACSVTESPLEAAFCIWWEICSGWYGKAGILPQREVAVDGEVFRVDFMAGIPAGYDLVVDPTKCLVVELDGHEFHERTKQQVERRNYRDRKLMEAGWRVLHFSGSEFHRDPLYVIDTVQKAVRALGQ